MRTLTLTDHNGETERQTMASKQQDKWIYQRKPRKCPECGGEKILDYLFGSPSSEGFKQAFEDGTAIMGGCCLDQMFVDDNLVRSWHCGSCGVDFHMTVNP